jgi:hypothetical protein
MKRKFTFLFVLVFAFLAAPAFAELDLEQEVLLIPDTHDNKPYIWQVRRNPRDYELDIVHEKSPAGENVNFTMNIFSKKGKKAEDVHLFITDRDLQTYEHIIPSPDGDGRYLFSYSPPFDDKYRFEVAFQTTEGWITLKKDIKLKATAKSFRQTRPGDRDYQITVKLIPARVYSEHVVTLLYEIRYKHQPVEDLQKIDGFDMQVGSWNKNLGEFIYATPKQNLGGPEVAVSLVFMTTGRHVVFAEFMHKGVKRRVEFDVDVYEEPKEDGGINTLQPSYY